MIVGADGRMIGTIGGGAGEAKIYHYALEIFTSGVKTIVDIDLSGHRDLLRKTPPERDTQGICGGMMKVWLERWDRSKLPLVREILERLQFGRGGAIVTSFQDCPHLVDTSVSTLHRTKTGFIEPIVAPPTLLIVGAGHVAVPLAHVAHLAGFQVIVTDDRADYATPERFPTADQVVAGAIDQVVQQLPTRSLYAALVTRGFQYDVAALQALIHYPTTYIGMIGSRKRVKQVLDQVREEGYSIDHIYAPIGLDIGALTPEEIAVSICAELIKVRRGGTGRSLSEL